MLLQKNTKYRRNLLSPCDSRIADFLPFVYGDAMKKQFTFSAGPMSDGEAITGSFNEVSQP
ncbi:MAG TPA: hypothetical protein DC036_05210, partial [Alphaproteobacteria bacterium]|nr:hypothetical protein [Alphaproteobacteria bacterium]